MLLEISNMATHTNFSNASACELRDDDLCYGFRENRQLTRSRINEPFARCQDTVRSFPKAPNIYCVRFSETQFIRV